MFRNKKIFFLLPFLITLPLLGLQCTKGVSQEVREASRPITLNWWSPFHDSADVKPIIDAYRAIHPNVTINFRKFRFEDYENEVVNALAEDRGPDILSLHNTWIRAWQPKLVTAPKTVTLPYQELKGGLKKEVITVLRTTPTLTTKNARNTFVEVVGKDVIVTPSATDEAEELYGLPMAVDTMALFYNRDILNLAGIPSPPATWGEFQGLMKKLTKLDQENKIVQAGVALGTARNVERAEDILALLMMQNGVQMIDERGQAVFDRIPAGLKGRTVAPGEEALTFYTDFANPGKEVYAWNDTLPNSLQAFAAGKSAFFFGYSYQLPILKNLAPKLNFEVTTVPQIEGNKEINFANYWVETVSKKTKAKDFAWDFVQFATNAKQVKGYLERAKKPTALRTLVIEQSEDFELGSFAKQTLTAQSWYRGKDPSAAEEAMLQMIESVNKSEMEPKAAIKLGAQKVNQTLK